MKITLALALLILMVGLAVTQTPKSDNHSTKTYKLSAEDSQAYARLATAKREAARAWNEANTAQLLILADAEVPKTERDREPVVEGDHFIFPPKPVPEKKGSQTP